MNTTTDNNNTCTIPGTLAVYSAWGANQNSADPDLARMRDVQHLFNRMTLGANRMDIEWALTMTPEQVVDRLVDLATEEINGVFTIPPPEINVHRWAYKRPKEDCEMMTRCASAYYRKTAIRAELAHGLIGNNHPLNPIYTPGNGSKTVLDQEIDRAKRFKYKMAWFWSNHFVIDDVASTVSDGNNFMWFKYILIYNALGNFKDFTKDVGLSQMMLYYLDAHRNYYVGNPNWEPNENFARELLELFTMGVANGSPGDYTIADIEELSKVFSGWRLEHWSPVGAKFREYILQPGLHDWNTKTIFGVTYTPVPDPGLDINNHYLAYSAGLGPLPNCTPGCGGTAPDRYAALWDQPNCFMGDRNTYGIKGAYDEYDKVHEILFGDFTGPEPYNPTEMSTRKRRIAKFICKELYKLFVYEKVGPNGETIIEDLAIIFETNWEIAPVVRALLKSEHFFMAKVRGCQFKSHLGSAFGLYTTMGVEYNSDYFLTDQFFDPIHYDPTDPYGYPNMNAPRTEPDTVTSYLRINNRLRDMGHQFFRPPNVNGFPGYRAWINEFTFRRLGIDLGYFVNYNFNDSRIPTRYKWRDFLVEISNNSSDPQVIVEAVVKHFIIIDLPPDQLERAVIAFKWTIPSNYFDDGTWNLNYDVTWTFNQYKSLLSFLVKQPEFYLT